VWDEKISQLTDPVDPVFVRDFIESQIYQPVPKMFVDKMVQDSLKVPARVWQATLQGLMNDSTYNKINLIKVPVLIIWGDKDTILPKEDQELLRKTIPDAKLVIYPNAGHVFYIEQPDRVALDVIKFIESL
jgi:pimeloyl-ACP methyl ester carboxylesterase